MSLRHLGRIALVQAVSERKCKRCFTAHGPSDRLLIVTNPCSIQRQRSGTAWSTHLTLSSTSPPSASTDSSRSMRLRRLAPAGLATTTAARPPGRHSQRRAAEATAPPPFRPPKHAFAAGWLVQPPRLGASGATGRRRLPCLSLPRQGERPRAPARGRRDQAPWAHHQACDSSGWTRPARST